MTTPLQTSSPQMDAPQDLKPTYTNLARISHSPADFVIDFAQMMPGENKAGIQARVFMSPLSAKLLLRALTENIARYETALGEITLPTTLADNLFKPFQPPGQSKE